ncbi:nuclear transport factor 2 family protein [Amycolatopsis sp. 3B14]|uniref:nuclear transport factor 2 family protein n=1 Tax=Amycolatopsis sp. 3B14 TaxID=3243600 RepID=UPI003D95F67C
MTRVLGALAAVAVLAAAWFGWSWWSAAHDDGLVRARDRDAVSTAAGDALVALNTIDYREAGAALDRWIAVTSGQLGSSLSGDRQGQVDRATAAKLVATASLRQIAVTEVDGDTARVIAVLDVSIASDGGEPKPGRSHLTADVARADGTWKITSVQGAS